MAAADEFGRIPVFEGLDPRDREALASIARPRAFGAGEQIFAEGEPGTGFHALTRGRVKVYKLSPEGKEQLLHVWGAGEIFGEVAVFEGGPFPAYAEALEPSRTLFVPREALLAAVRRDPEFALRLLAVLARRLRMFASQVEDLTLREVPARLAAYLLLRDAEQGNRGLVELDLAKGQLANLLGATPETFSRVLARLAREGLVRSESARGLRLADPAALAELAAGRLRLN